MSPAVIEVSTIFSDDVDGMMDEAAAPGATRSPSFFLLDFSGSLVPLSLRSLRTNREESDGFGGMMLRVPMFGSPKSSTILRVSGQQSAK